MQPVPNDPRQDFNTVLANAAVAFDREAATEAQRAQAARSQLAQVEGQMAAGASPDIIARNRAHHEAVAGDAESRAARHRARAAQARQGLLLITPEDGSDPATMLALGELVNRAVAENRMVTSAATEFPAS